MSVVYGAATLDSITFGIKNARAIENITANVTLSIMYDRYILDNKVKVLLIYQEYYHSLR
jgi:hypothetical protein